MEQKIGEEIMSVKVSYVTWHYDLLIIYIARKWNANPKTIYGTSLTLLVGRTFC